MKKKGPVLCLTARPEVIYERVKDHRHRPLLNVSDPKEAIHRLLKEREIFYGRADLSVDTSNLTLDEVVAEIVGLLEKKPHG